VTAARHHEAVEFKTEGDTGRSDAKDVRVIMRPKHLLLALTMFAIAGPTVLLGQQHALPGDTEAPLLTLDDAVSVALKNNLLVTDSGLEAQKYDFRVNTIRSRWLPQCQFAVLGGILLRPCGFTFPAGVFGTYKEQCAGTWQRGSLTENVDERYVDAFERLPEGDSCVTTNEVQRT